VDLKAFFDPYDPPATDLIARLRYWAELRPHDTSFRFTDGEGNDVQLTYAQLWLEARRLAAYLQSQGAGGERIVLLYPPGLEFVVGFFACHAAGAVAVPAYPPRKNRKATRVRGIAENAGAKFALSTANVVEQIERNPEQRQDLREMRLLATDVPSARIDGWADPKIDPSSLAVLQYTSGSTGSPKGVMLTHRNLMVNCELIMHAFEYTRDGLGLSWLPTYHDMGLVGGVLNPLYAGLPTLLMSPMTFLQKPSRWLRAISDYQVSITGGPNFAYELCLEKIEDRELEGLDLRRWTTAYNGAEPVRASTLQAFAARFARYGFHRRAFLPCYGMAETTLIVTGGPRAEAPASVTVVGRALDNRQVELTTSQDPSARQLIGCGVTLPESKVWIVDPDTRERLPAERVGEIWIQGPTVGEGYWQQSEKTAATFHAETADGEGPFLRTGDLGFFHAGQLYVAGRLKDMIIVRGVNRYPQDIEYSVEEATDCVTHGAVAAFAMDRDGREQLVIVAEGVRRRDVDWDAQIQTIRQAVTRDHDLPPDAVFITRPGSIPKTSSGKIQRHACEASLRDNTLQVVARWQRWEELGLGVGRGPVMQAAAVTLGGTSGEAGTVDKPRSAATRQPAAETVAVVMHHIRSIARERAESLSLDTNIVLDLGLDSLERLEIAHAIEQAFGGRFPEDVLQEIETLREVALAVEDHLPSNSAASLGLQPASAATKLENASRETPSENYRFEQLPEYRRFKQTSAQLLLTGVPNPYFSVHEGIVRDTTVVGGRELVSFASYNYLGTSGDPVVSNAAKSAIDRYGTSVSASRLVSGEKPLHRDLERAIADFIGVEDALVFVGGHSTNETTIGHLVGPGDLILHDALAHNSMIQGAILSGARRRPFPHNDWRTLEELLKQVRHEYRRVLIAVEGAYSMDGDFCDLPELIRIKKEHHAWLMVDEAHCLGVMGKTGHGIGEHYGADPHAVDIWMSTLSKSLGSCGGYIAGCSELVEYLRYTAPGFVFSVGLPPPAAAAALASLRLLEDEPQRVAVLQARSAQFLELARARGLNTGLAGGTGVVPVITGNSLLALRLSRRLFERGINVQPILYPAVEEAAARLRFFITSCHSPEQIERAVNETADALESLGVILQPRRTAREPALAGAMPDARR